MDTYYEHELPYHQLFINRLRDGFPHESCRNECVVLGNEIATGRGTADLLAVDSGGRAWIIEAKIRKYLDTSDPVQQLVDYRDGLMTMAAGDLQRLLLSFIRQDSRNRRSFIGQDGPDGTDCRHPADDLRKEFRYAESVEEAIETWLSIHDTDANSAYIRDQFFTQLKRGTAGLCVLADGRNDSVVNHLGSIRHDGPVAYVYETFQKGRSQCIMFNDSPLRSPQVFDCIPALREYELEQQAKRVTGVEKLMQRLRDEAGYLLAEVVLPACEEAGWTVKSTATYNSLDIQTGIEGNKVTIAQVGVADPDVSLSAGRRRLASDQDEGLKVDWHTGFLRRKGLVEKTLVEEWAPKFYQAGWRGKGKGEYIGQTKHIADVNYDGWNGVMKYKPKHDGQDFFGRSGEEEALKTFLDLLRGFVASVIAGNS
jgi:hypothetical protein